MRRVLITGMSAVGKSSVIEELDRRGYEAIDLDTPEWSEYGYVAQVSPGFEPDREWLWKEERVEQLLISHDTGTLFVSGCAPNQGRFYPLFDDVILLTVSESVTKKRLAIRTNNEFGKTQEELTKVLSDKATFEERLAAGADVVIDAEAPLDSVVEEIINVGEGTRG